LWSYSLSAQIKEPFSAPRSAVHDCHRQVSINRIGARIRISGGAELGGTREVHNEKIIKLLYQALQSNFPGAADYSRSMQTWKGGSIFSPDALPLIGPAGTPGVWLNLAHGHNGWSMACGSARVLADQIQGRPTALDATLLHPGRFNS
jgi:D-amino-acid dehydrogenase